MIGMIKIRQKWREDEETNEIKNNAD